MGMFLAGLLAIVILGCIAAIAVSFAVFLCSRLWRSIRTGARLFED